jgi:carboxypeptidase T
MRVVLRVLIVCLLLSVPVRALPSEEPFQEIRVQLVGGRLLSDLRAVRGLEVMGLGDGDVRLLSTPSLTEQLVARGWSVDVLHEDLQTYYASRGKVSGMTGVWHTYEETVQELNNLHAGFPAIVSEPFSIGQSGEGREIWAIRISDNPDILEDEPEVLFDGVHHAREIMTVETLLAFANYLCDNYPEDGVVRELVEQRQITLVPIVNPDGFVYNEQISPGGGGMWRKNRKPNGGSCFGVDVNRNYPFHWGSDDGSSGDPCAEDYRGPSAGSEPETQAMMALVDAHRFVTHNSFHAVAGMVLFPWCYADEPAPDDETFRLVAREMVRASAYAMGRCPELLYTTSGDFLDWTYGQTEARPAVFSFSTEVGGSGFWPDPSEKDGLIQENLPSMLYLAKIAGPAIRADEIIVQDDDGDRQIEPGESCVIRPTVQNDGVVASGKDVRLLLRCDDPYVQMLHTSDRLGSIGPARGVTGDPDSLAFRVEEGCPSGRRGPFTLMITGAAGLRVEVPLELGIGQSSAVYEDDFESAGGAWETDPATTASAGLFERIDPNPTSSQPGDDTTPAPGVNAWITGQNSSDGDGDVDGGTAAARSPRIDLSGMDGAYLTMNYFHGQRDGGDDPDGDFFRISVSSDDGESWVDLVSIGDSSTSATWRTLAVDLDGVIDLTDRVRLRIEVADGPADGDLIEGGVDDVRILVHGPINQPPGTPTSIAPADGALNVSSQPDLSVGEATDAEGDPLTYGFRLFGDEGLTRLVASGAVIPEEVGGASWRVPETLSPGTYWWRTFAEDPTQRGLYGEVRSFTVSDSSVIPVPDKELTAGPNPMKDLIHIRYAAPPSLTSSLSIHDARGRLVRRLDVAPSASGWRTVDWDGRDEAGRRVPCGPYWARLRTPEGTRTLQLIRVK